MTSYSHDTYISPVTWRYGGEAMRIVWSEAEKRRLLRRFWVALAQAQADVGLVSAEQVADLVAHQDDIDIERAAEIEAEIRRDLMAEIKTYAEQCPVGGAIIHLGATSMDVLDNVDALRLIASLDLIVGEVEKLLISLAGRIVAVADAYDTITSVRSYKTAASPAEGREEIARCAGDQFDPVIVKAFLAVSVGKLRSIASPLCGS